MKKVFFEDFKKKKKAAGMSGGPCIGEFWPVGMPGRGGSPAQPADGVTRLA